MSRKLILGLIFLCCILCTSSVCASEINNETIINETCGDLLSQEDNFEILNEEVPDVPDLVVNETLYVDSNNIDDFFVDGVLQSKYTNKTLVFSGKLENFGKLVVGIDNVTLKGTGSNLKNVVFDVSGNNVTLDGFNMELDSNFADNDGAAIQVGSNNVNLFNLNINYVVPTNVEAYGIFGVSNQKNPLRFLRIINSTINFEGHNEKALVYNCGIKLLNCHDSIIKNNTILTYLPLKDVNFGVHGATLDSDYVMSVGMEGCNNFTFADNIIISEVNNRPTSNYPTLDCILISQSHNSLIYNNSIYISDFETKPGLDNYLYGIDIYALENLTVTKNNVNIVTTGGKLASGTAYPIQVTGPIDRVNITDNDLYSFSNGPNIGIYSQNYYGATALSITNNRINVTGLAGVHEWALVAGIESQDSNSIIHNNTIEVHSVGNVNIDDNIYGVSYRQHTAGNHSFDIQNNTVFSDGFYSVSILDSVDSTIANNLLISYNENAANSNNGYNYGNMASHSGDEFYNNRVIRYNDYFASINNDVDGGDEFNYENPTNDKGLTNEIDGSSIGSKDDRKSYNYNPLISGSSSSEGRDTNPHDTDNQGNDDLNGNNGKSDDGDGSGVGPHGGNGNSSSDVISLSDLLADYMNSNTDEGDVNITTDNVNSANARSNNTDSTPSDVGPDSSSSESQSQSQVAASPGSSGKSSVSKAFELEDLTKNPAFIPSVVAVIIILMLIVVGYKRRNTKFD